MPAQPLELRAEPRIIFGKHVRRLRRQGILPANIFGHGESRAIQTPLRALEQLLARGGRTGVVTLALDGKNETALLKDIQRDPRSGQVIHVEFQAVSMDQTVTSVVPLRFTGESHAASKLGGVMTHPTTQLRVEARAADLPDVIEVDLSVLEEMHSSIKVTDLPTSSKYRLLDPPDEVVAVVLPPKVEVEEVEVPEEEAAEEAEAAAEGEPEAAPPGAPEAQATEE